MLAQGQRRRRARVLGRVALERSSLGRVVAAAHRSRASPASAFVADERPRVGDERAERSPARSARFARAAMRPMAAVAFAAASMSARVRDRVEARDVGGVAERAERPRGLGAHAGVGVREERPRERRIAGARGRDRSRCSPVGGFLGSGDAREHRRSRTGGAPARSPR